MHHSFCHYEAGLLNLLALIEQLRGYHCISNACFIILF